MEERTQRLLKCVDNQRRTVLRSPVDGVIKTLNVATLGGVLRPGLTVVEDRVPARGVRALRSTRLPAGRAGTFRLPLWAA